MCEILVLRIITNNIFQNTMKVFKFGGASIKNAVAIRNMTEIIRGYKQYQLIVVVSAMGKTTNALERIHSLKRSGKNYKDELTTLIDYHLNIFSDLKLDRDPYLDGLTKLFLELENKINTLTGTENINYS